MAAFVGVAVAGSAFIAVTAIGNAANLLADLFIVAAMALAIRVASGSSGGAAIVALVAAAAVTHWMFGIVLTALIAITVVFASVRRIARPEPESHPPRRYACCLRW